MLTDARRKFYGGCAMKKKKNYRGESRNVTEQRDRILTAWNRGDKTFDEVVAITGYKPSTVAQYLPRSENG